MSTVSPLTTFSVERRKAPAAAPSRVHKRAYTKAEIIERLRAWSVEYGAAPRAADWDPGRARRLGQTWRVERFASGGWPTARMVTRQFKTFNAALEAAGMDPPLRERRLRPALAGPWAILDAIIEWSTRYGEPPLQADWDPARARKLGQDWRIVRYQADDWPSLRSTVAHFGSLGNAVRAAGMVPRRRGSHGVGNVETRNLTIAKLVALHLDRDGDAPERLGAAVDRLVSARRDLDDQALRAALIHLAGAAQSWARSLNGFQPRLQQISNDLEQPTSHAAAAA